MRSYPRLKPLLAIAIQGSINEESRPQPESPMKTASLALVDATVVIGLSLFLVGSAAQGRWLHLAPGPCTSAPFQVAVAVLIVLGLLTRRRRPRML